MWIRITENRLRLCPECNQSCLKVSDPFDNEEMASDEVGVCLECHEDMVAAFPSEYFRELLE